MEVPNGKRILQTSLIKEKMPASQVALKYKELWQVEKGFQDIKSVLETVLFIIGGMRLSEATYSAVS
jgi:hypothetical protein